MKLGQLLFNSLIGMCYQIRTDPTFFNECYVYMLIAYINGYQSKDVKAEICDLKTWIISGRPKFCLNLLSTL